MAATVAELTPAELRTLIAEVVHDQLTELLADPDQGQELRPEFVELVNDRMRRFTEEPRTLSLGEAFDEIERG